MRKLRNYWVVLSLATVAFFGASCDNNDEIVVDPNAEFDAVLEVVETTKPTPNVDVTVDANKASSIKAKVSFTTTTKDMARLYITQNIKGAGETLYTPTESVDTKADGAIDLSKKNSKNFEFQFTLPVPSGVGANGTVVYKFWTTTGNGDFRDVTQKLAVGAGTITLKFGTATNPAATEAPIKSYSAKLLAAPLADGSSLTFISLIDGVTYKINDGAEKARYWDFGYYYTSTSTASLASTAAYETSFVNTQGQSIVDVDGIAKTTELNKAYFALSTKTSANFDAVTKAGDLTFTAPTVQKINGLKAGDIVEFVDNYGKKGLIRVVEVKGTFNSGDYIKLDIKVQP